MVALTKGSYNSTLLSVIIQELFIYSDLQTNNLLAVTVILSSAVEFPVSVFHPSLRGILVLLCLLLSFRGQREEGLMKVIEKRIYSVD